MRVDLQTHTRHSSSCGWMDPERLVAAAAARGLDGVAVTDHNTMAGVAAASEAAPDDLLVIAGEEVDTTDGQVIGLFLDDPVEAWRPPADVIDDIHTQDGLAVAPHPFDELRDGLASIEAHADALDAVETVNSRCLRDRYNRRAAEFARKHGLPAVGGSDAHFAHEVGRAYTRVERDPPPDGVVTAPSVRDAVSTGDVSAQGGRGTPLSHAGTKLVKLWNGVRGSK